MRRNFKPNTFGNFELEEYKTLREEMRQREGAMTQLILIVLTSIWIDGQCHPLKGTH
jgi:hypothetical protein